MNILRHYSFDDDGHVIGPEPTPEDFMHEALLEAQKAYKKGEVPIGAVAVHRNRVIARAYNQVELLKDGTAHAEMVVLTQAAAALGDWRLNEVDLYVTKEPCAMCAGALVNTRIHCVYYGMRDDRSGACGGALDVIRFPGMLWQCKGIGGVLELECKELIQRFFRERRNGSRV